VVGFSLAIALLAGVLAGLAPALQTPASGIATALREGDRQTGSRGQWRLRAALVVGEVALSFLLLVGAGLLVRSFSQLMTVDRGFHTENGCLPSACRARIGRRAPASSSSTAFSIASPPCPKSSPPAP
jgi:hypothetical protein